METIAYCIIILAFLFILYQTVLLIIYLRPFVLDSILKRKKSWNPYYDPTFTILLISFFFITIGFTYLLVSNNKLTNSAIILYAVLVFLVNTFFSLLFFGRKKLIQIKSKEQIEDEQAKQEKNAKIELLEGRKFMLNERDLEEKKTITKKLLDLEKSHINGIAGIQVLSEVSIQNQKIITKNLEEIKKTNTEGISILNLKADKNINNNVSLTENLNVLKRELLEDSNYRNSLETSRLVDGKIITREIENIIKTNCDDIIKSLTPKKSIKTNSDTINYNSLFNENQLIYLFLEFKKHGIIDDDYLKKDFINKFLSEQIMINMEGTSLYYLHREISKVLIKKITLKHFVTFFKNNKGNNFDFNSLRQAVKNKNHKLVLEFKEIFEYFLDKHSLQSKECKS